MRLLFALTVIFALLWAGTGIATSSEQAGFTGSWPSSSQQEPEDTFVTLLALNYAAYSGGVSCLAIMGAGLIVTGHRRLQGASVP